MPGRVPPGSLQPVPLASGASQASQSTKKRKIQESIGENARPRNQAFGRFRNLQMLYLDFHPMNSFSRENFQYNKALATTLEGSRKFLGGTYSRSGCDETGSATEIWRYIGKKYKGRILRTGSGVIQMGSDFGKMTPWGLGSFLDWAFGLPRPKKYKKPS